jgi:signal transduction histidine kinase
MHLSPEQQPRVFDHPHASPDRSQRLEAALQRFQSTLDLDALPTLIARETAQTIGAQFAYICYSAGGHQVDATYSSDLYLAYPPSARQLPPSILAPRSVDTVLCSLLYPNDELPDEQRCLIAPILDTGSVAVGAILLANVAAGLFTEQDALDLQRLAVYASLALANAAQVRELQTAVLARNELLSMISHDLSNPLTAIKGQIQFLQMQLARGTALDTRVLTRSLGSIDGAVLRMQALIADLFDTAMMQLGQSLQLHCRSADLVALVRQAIDDQQRTTALHTIRLHAPQPEIEGLWDNDRLYRVMVNLLANAVKYSPQGGDIWVGVERCGDHGERVEITVRDYGLGIPTADLPHIFTRFHRASNVSHTIQGTGVGLSSARHIVEQHGGTISVQSIERVGTTFTVLLPLQ